MEAIQDLWLWVREFFAPIKDLVMTETTATVVSGVIVFVASEYIREVWLMPLQEYKKLKQRVSYALTFYANYYSNPSVYQEANEEERAIRSRYSNEIRDLASELRAFLEIMPAIHIGIPSKEKLYEASVYLIGLSNSFYRSSGGHDSAGCRYTLYTDVVYKNMKIYGYKPDKKAVKK